MKRLWKKHPPSNISTKNKEQQRKHLYRNMLGGGGIFFLVRSLTLTGRCFQRLETFNKGAKSWLELDSKYNGAAETRRSCSLARQGLIRISKKIFNLKLFGNLITGWATEFKPGTRSDKEKCRLYEMFYYSYARPLCSRWPCVPDFILIAR